VGDILGSYRWRRRLAWAGAAVLVVVVSATVIVLLPGASPKRADQLGGVTGRIEPSAEDLRQETKVTPAERRAVTRTLRAFIATAVTRDDPAAAWNLVTSAMREGITRAEWNRGDVPVVPYPVAVPKQPEWTVVTSYAGDLTIDVVLQPRRGSRRPAASFFVELKRARDGRWLIDSMYPEDFFALAPQAKTKGAKGASAKAAQPEYPHGQLSPLWIVVPLGLLGLVILVPAGIVLFTWRRQRAIDRRYRAAQQRHP